MPPILPIRMHGRQARQPVSLTAGQADSHVSSLAASHDDSQAASQTNRLATQPARPIG